MDAEGAVKDSLVYYVVDATLIPPGTEFSKPLPKAIFVIPRYTTPGHCQRRS